MKKIKNILCCLLAVLSIVILFIGIFMIINGSFEMFPTEEQMGKAHLVGGIVFAVGVVLESASVMLFYKNNKKNKP